MGAAGPVRISTKGEQNDNDHERRYYTTQKGEGEREREGVCVCEESVCVGGVTRRDNTEKDITGLLSPHTSSPLPPTHHLQPQTKQTSETDRRHHFLSYLSGPQCPLRQI